MDLGILPIVTRHSGDAGPYITAGSVWCHDMETGEYKGSWKKRMVIGHETQAALPDLVDQPADCNSEQKS